LTHPAHSRHALQRGRLRTDSVRGHARALIELVLAAVAILIVFESRRPLVGSSADRRLVRRVRAIARGDRDVLRTGNPLTMYLGPDHVLLNLDIQIRGGLTTPEIAAAVDRIELAVRREFPVVQRIFIEAESLRDVDARGRDVVP
jgi:divalent metal cation (Fe/Co/Zn/Cd) transporter